MNYTRLSELTDIEIIARGHGVDVHAVGAKRHQRRLNRTHGRGAWRKLKGRAVIEYTNGEICCTGMKRAISAAAISRRLLASGRERRGEGRKTNAEFGDSNELRQMLTE